jgi:carbamate kinase
MLIVVALGGNALLRRGEPMTAENQRANVARAASVLADLVGEGHSIVITHGNGPQVGLLALQAAATPDGGTFPLDVLGAESAGMIGYVIEQELGNLLRNRLFATLLTQVKVDPRDPAFGRPTKPIGPVYDEATARRLAAERGWQIAPDGDKWRRVVPSPRPLEILEASVISFLTERDVIVICTGGGGVPVVEGTDGSLCGVEAVIDKDLASSLLARQLKADMLLMLTDVDAVYADYGTPQARALRRVATTEISGRNFPDGSMGPKVGAAVEFAEATGKPAAIGKLDDALAIVRGERGTWLEAPAKEA